MIGRNIKFKAMKNTDFTLESLGSFISSEQSFSDILDLVKDFDLELTGVSLS